MEISTGSRCGNVRVLPAVHNFDVTKRDVAIGYRGIGDFDPILDRVWAQLVFHAGENNRVSSNWQTVFKACQLGPRVAFARNYACQEFKRPFLGLFFSSGACVSLQHRRTNTWKTFKMLFTRRQIPLGLIWPRVRDACVLFGRFYLATMHGLIH